MKNDSILPLERREKCGKMDLCYVQFAMYVLTIALLKLQYPENPSFRMMAVHSLGGEKG